MIEDIANIYCVCAFVGMLKSGCWAVSSFRGGLKSQLLAISTAIEPSLYSGVEESKIGISSRLFKRFKGTELSLVQMYICYELENEWFAIPLIQKQYPLLYVFSALCVQLNIVVKFLHWSCTRYLDRNELPSTLAQEAKVRCPKSCKSSRSVQIFFTLKVSKVLYFKNSIVRLAFSKFNMIPRCPGLMSCVERLKRLSF